MSMHAVAVLKVPYAKVVEVLGEVEGPDAPPAGGTWVGSPEGPMAITPLEDGAVLHTGAPVASEPDAIGALLAATLGQLAALHDDERGILVLPDRARGEAASYAALVDDAADLGDWVTLPAAGMPPGLDSMMGQVAAMMGSDPQQMQGLWSQAQQMMSDPSAQSRLMEAAQAMMGQMQSGQGLDFGALAAQAEKVAKENPDLLAQIQGQMGQPSASEDPSLDDDGEKED